MGRGHPNVALVLVVPSHPSTPELLGTIIRWSWISSNWEIVIFIFLLASLMYSQQQQSTALPSSLCQPPTDLYPPKSNLPLDPIFFAQHALLQAGLDASNRQHQTNHHHHHHQQQQQQQMALAMANLLGQWSSNPFLSLQQRRDLCESPTDGIFENPIQSHLMSFFNYSLNHLWLAQIALQFAE